MSKKAKSIVADVNNSQVISNTVARTASKKSVVCIFYSFITINHVNYFIFFFQFEMYCNIFLG